MAYSALSLPKLETEGPDLIGAFAKGRALRDAGIRTALMQEDLENRPAQREREARQFEQQERTWSQDAERFEREKKGWDLADKTKELEYRTKSADYVRNRLISTPFEGYPALRKELMDENFDVSRFPENIATPEEYEQFKGVAVRTLDIMKQEMAQKFQSGEAEKSRTFQAGESEKSRLFQAEESGKSRQHAKDTGQLYETSEGLLPRDQAIGKAKWRDPREVKLSEEDKFQIGNLKKEAEGLIKIVQDFQMGKPDDMGKPITPEQRNKAFIRLKEIKGEIKTIVDAARPVNAPAATTAPTTAIQPGPTPPAQTPPTAPPQPGAAEASAAPATEATRSPAPPTNRTGSIPDRKARLEAVKKAMAAKGVDPMSDPRVKALQEAIDSQAIEEQADLEGSSRGSERSALGKVVEHVSAPERGGAFVTFMQKFKEFMNKPSKPLYQTLVKMTTEMSPEERDAALKKLDEATSGSSSALYPPEYETLAGYAR